MILIKYYKLLIFFIAFGAIVACAPDKEKLKKVRKIKTEIGVEKATEVTINYTDSGNLRAKIYSPLIEHYQQKAEPYSEMKKGVKGFFYNNYGKIESSLTAEYAISYETRRIVVVKNNVKVLNMRGEELETEKLIWDQQKEKIYTDKFVKIKTPDEILYGNGLESNQSFTRYRINKLRGRITVK
ncbi:MAG: LPS export ABC transporter periplasmic protein LptC [Bacteroidetes bacterium]|nr:LPS export ABC transporter periplasmic protein LptC [Bacteroidota bacterium]